MHTTTPINAQLQVSDTGKINIDTSSIITISDSFKNLQNGASFKGLAKEMQNGETLIQTNFGKIVLTPQRRHSIFNGAIQIEVEQLTDSLITLKITQEKQNISDIHQERPQTPKTLEIRINKNLASNTTTNADSQVKYSEIPVIRDKISMGIQRPEVELKSIYIDKQFWNSIFSENSPARKLLSNELLSANIEPEDKIKGNFVIIRDSDVISRMAGKEFLINEDGALYLKCNLITHEQYNVTSIKTMLGCFIHDSYSWMHMKKGDEFLVIQLTSLEMNKDNITITSPTKVQIAENFELLKNLIQKAEETIRNASDIKTMDYGLLPSFSKETNHHSQINVVFEMMALLAGIKRTSKDESTENTPSTQKTNILSLLREVYTQTASLEYQLIMLPFFYDGKIEFCKIYIKNEEEKKDDDNSQNPDKTLNFKLEIDLRNLGPIVMDGKFTSKSSLRKLECEIQTEHGFPYYVKEEIHSAFSNCCDALTLQGKILFSHIQHQEFDAQYEHVTDDSEDAHAYRKYDVVM